MYSIGKRNAPRPRERENIKHHERSEQRVGEARGGRCACVRIRGSRKWPPSAARLRRRRRPTSLLVRATAALRSAAASCSSPSRCVVALAGDAPRTFRLHFSARRQLPNLKKRTSAISSILSACVYIYPSIWSVYICVCVQCTEEREIIATYGAESSLSSSRECAKNTRRIVVPRVLLPRSTAPRVQEIGSRVWSATRRSRFLDSSTDMGLGPKAIIPTTSAPTRMSQQSL